MNVGQLIEMLQDMNPDHEVRLAFQPEWPFEYRMGPVLEVDNKVYIAEAGQIRYLPTKVAVELEWSEAEELEEEEEEEEEQEA